MAPCPARMRLALFLSPIFLAFALATSGCGDTNVGKAESVAALAGAAGGPGFFDGSASDPVRFDSPYAVAVTATGDRFVADMKNHVIRKVDATGRVTTFAGAFGVAGSADGTGTAARFNLPSGIVAVGTTLYVCDTGNHTIREIVSTSGLVTTVAGTPGVPGAIDNTLPGNVLFSSPRGITSDGGTNLYVADTGNHKIRKVISASGATTTFAGSGTPGFADNTGTTASFVSPEGITFDGSSLFVADTGNHAIRKITPVGTVGEVTTLAGDGTSGFLDNAAGGSARFSSPVSLVAIGSNLFVSDTGNHVVRQVEPAGFVTTLAGLPQVAGFSDGTGSAARFNSLKGIAVQEGVSNLFYVADTENHVIRQVSVGGTVVTTAGSPPQAGLVNSTGESARFDAPAGVTVIGDDLFVSDTGNNTVRKVTASGVVTSLTGSVFNGPRGIVAVGTDLYVADSENHAIRKVTSAGVVTPFAGSDAGVEGFANGTGTAARFRMPKGIATDGSFLYVADTGNHAVRKIDIGSAAVTTVAGDGTPGLPTDTPSRFRSPEGIAFLGGNIYVADTGNHAVQKVTPAGVATNFAGSSAGVSGSVDDTGTAARFHTPRGIAGVDPFLYVADTGNHTVRRISTSRKVITFAGDPGAATTINGDPSAARMNAPTGIAGVPGTIYFTDTNENVIRKILF
ncbi:MAG TPA: NHL repeat-containing protein [Candidatus Deferrimicrobiaceae bacterium]|nr:NHL repeat-containing protein [Candidatus Deferrimicrobiaceae bacterium]